MLKVAHASHYGSRLMWRRTRRCIFWPALRSELEDFCNNCGECLAFQSRQADEPMMETTSATHPFQVVFQDVFRFENQQFLVTVDVFSDFFEVDKLGETATTRKVVEASKRHFATYGIPVELHTDNGPQYGSEEFRNFVKTWNISHVTSSPYFAQSNGEAEGAVKIAKKLLKKCSLSKEDYNYGLLETRNVSQKEGISRAEKFFGRRLRSKLPERLNGSKLSNESIKMSNRRKFIARKKHYDNGIRQLKELKEGDVVRVQPTGNDSRWEKAVCQEPAGPRSYLVKLSGGTLIRRNRRHL